MATPRITKPTFINTNVKPVGYDELIAARNALRDLMETTDELALKAVRSKDRKGLAMVMKGTATAERAAKSLQRSLDRARRYRLTKDEKAIYEAEATKGTLPAGIELVVIEPDVDADDDDDEDDD